MCSGGYRFFCAKLDDSGFHFICLSSIYRWKAPWPESTSDWFLRQPQFSLDYQPCPVFKYTQIPLNSCLFFFGGEVSEPTPVRVNFIWLMIENLGDQCYWAYMNFYIQLPLGFSKHFFHLLEFGETNFYKGCQNWHHRIHYRYHVLGFFQEPLVRFFACRTSLKHGFRKGQYFNQSFQVGYNWKGESFSKSPFSWIHWGWNFETWKPLGVETLKLEIIHCGLKLWNLKNHWGLKLWNLKSSTGGWNFETWKPLGVETLKLEIIHWGLKLWSVSPPHTIN